MNARENLTDPGTTRQLIALVVEALELGTKKYEQDVAEDLFRAFGVDLARVEARAGSDGVPFPVAATVALAVAAPSAGALMTEVVRCGGRFVAMIEDIYELLAAHAATSAGAAESFVIKRDDLDAEIAISAAFIEKLRLLQQVVRSVVVGRVDNDALSRFVGNDDGELYGTWPIGAGSDVRLLDMVLSLAWLAVPTDLVASLAAARSAAERLVTAAERLIEGHMLHSAALQSDDVDELFTELTDYGRLSASAELDQYRQEGLLASIARAYHVVGVEQDSAAGLCEGAGGALETAVLPREDRECGTGVGQLAMFVTMWRRGIYAKRSRDRLEKAIAADPVFLERWLEEVRTGCEEATLWLTERAVVRTGSIPVRELIEAFEEYLNLPLWRERAVVYEIWILCETLRTCEQLGWVAQLRLGEHQGTVWTLSTAPTSEPVAELRLSEADDVAIEVWREPSRQIQDGPPLTPDLAISSAGDAGRDLVVIEAKDRYEMRARGAKPDTALVVGRKYRTALRPIATWVCNHCDYREDDASPAVNYGDVWSQLHLAPRFRPGSVPAEFAASLAAALTPPGVAPQTQASVPPATNRLVIVADVTGSMRWNLDAAWSVLQACPPQGFSELRAVLYCDHGANDPFLVREVGPCADFGPLLELIDAEPSGGGGGAEALEDAMRRCRELAVELGPLTVLVLTDMPPHPAEECPLAIDFAAEVRHLLDAGGRCLVASDWQSAADSTWDRFTDEPQFLRAPLAELVARDVSALKGRGGGPS